MAADNLAHISISCGMIFSSQYFKFIAKLSRYVSDIGNRTTGPGVAFDFTDLHRNSW